MNDGQIVFEIKADGSKAKDTINQITKQMQQAANKWDDSADNVQDNVQEITDTINREGQKWNRNIEQNADFMQSAMNRAFDVNRIKEWALEAGKAVLDFAKEAISAASDLEEVQNVVDVTFGDAAGQIQTWANKAGKQFGLTETQAKKFTSTLGAMAKSSGIASNDIVKMSTDLAGLAADMASFYNLDFETAFEKIKSGITGETEPLKALGINMSAANLEAFALQQGLEKTFSKMDQGEQTLLRYQYLMSATADAQGDFARTSDGYANSLRKMETNIESLKTKIGKILVPAMSDGIAAINGLLEKLMPTDSRTVLDEFEDINLNTSAKIQAIQKTAEEARDLVGVLDSIVNVKTPAANAAVEKIATDISNISLNQEKPALVNELLTTLTANITALEEATGKDKDSVQTWLNGIATQANGLEDGKPEEWNSLISAIVEGIPGLENTTAGQELLRTLKGIEESKAGSALQTLSDELGKIDLSKGKAGVVKDTIATLAANIDTLSEVTGEEATGVSEWLNNVAAAADGLTDGTTSNWTALAEMLKQGIPGIEDTEGGKNIVDAISEQVGDIGEISEDTAKRLKALGIDTDGITDKNQLWLETCKRLVQTIPGLAAIINTETGEVKGGTQAIKDYITAWETGETKLAMIAAHEQKQNALSQKFSELPMLELDMLVAQKRLRDRNKQILELAKKYNASMAADLESGVLDYGNASQVLTTGRMYAAMTPEERTTAEEISKDYYNLVDAVDSTTEAYKKQKTAYDEAAEALKYEAETIEEMPDGLKKAGAAADEWSTTMQQDARDAVAAAQTALSEMTTYADSARAATLAQVDSIVKGFEKMPQPLAQVRARISELVDKIHNGGTEEQLAAWNKELDELNKRDIQLNGMSGNLDSQLAFMDNYLTNLKKAQQMGLSNELLSFLSDGSQESADYLEALVSGAGEAAKEIDAKFKEVQQKKDEFSNALTDQKLAADAMYQGMVDKAAEAVAALNMNGEAAEASGDTIKGLAQGIAAHVPDVKTAVDSILAELDRLSGWGVSIDLGAFGKFGFQLDGSFATGLDYVPFNGFLAELHEGEGILTAEENRIWQRFKDGGAASQNVDYDALGGVMRDNVHAGGNVYLDGRTVGRVISEEQGASYRTLKRSGWQV